MNPKKTYTKTQPASSTYVSTSINPIEPKVKELDYVPIKKREDFEGNPLSYYHKGNAPVYGPPVHGALANYYFGVPIKWDILTKSKYKPSISTDPNAEYVAIADNEWKKHLIKYYNYIKSTKPNEKGLYGKSRELPPRKPGITTSSLSGIKKRGEGKWSIREGWRADPELLEDKIEIPYKKNKTIIARKFWPAPLGEYGFYEGNDKRGKYIAYYDKWDIQGFKGNMSVKLKAGKPFEVYDRIYLDEFDDILNEESIGKSIKEYEMNKSIEEALVTKKLTIKNNKGDIYDVSGDDIASVRDAIERKRYNTINGIVKSSENIKLKGTDNNMKPSWESFYEKARMMGKGDTETYALHKAYNDLPGIEVRNFIEDQNGHLPDKYKTARHPTMSNESIYSTKITPGGQWIQKGASWTYKPTPTNVKAVGTLEDYKEWFRRNEPNVKLDLSEVENKPFIGQTKNPE